MRIAPAPVRFYGSSPKDKSRAEKEERLREAVQAYDAGLGDYRVSDALLEELTGSILQQVEDLIPKRTPRQQ